jgi:hypothetical protein
MGVRYGSRLCESSNRCRRHRKLFRPRARRHSIMLRARLRLPIGRTTFFAFRARASFHTAWVISAGVRPAWSCPLCPLSAELTLRRRCRKRHDDNPEMLASDSWSHFARWSECPLRRLVAAIKRSGTTPSFPEKMSRHGRQMCC